MNKEDTKIDTTSFNYDLQEKPLDLAAIHRSIRPKFITQLKKIRKNICKNKQKMAPFKIILTKPPGFESKNPQQKISKEKKIHKIEEFSHEKILGNQTHELPGYEYEFIPIKPKYSQQNNRKSFFKPTSTEKNVRLINLRNEFNHMLKDIRKYSNPQEQERTRVTSSKRSLNDRYPEIYFYEKKENGFEIWL